MEIVLSIAALVVLGCSAVAFGHDSRGWDQQDPWRTDLRPWWPAQR